MALALASEISSQSQVKPSQSHSFRAKPSQEHHYAESAHPFVGLNRIRSLRAQEQFSPHRACPEKAGGLRGCIRPLCIGRVSARYKLIPGLIPTHATTHPLSAAYTRRDGGARVKYPTPRSEEMPLTSEMGPLDEVAVGAGVVRGEEPRYERLSPQYDEEAGVGVRAVMEGDHAPTVLRATLKHRPQPDGFCRIKPLVPVSLYVARIKFLRSPVAEFV
ncbi:hypothetical protein B0H10DRAFT_1962663 [Mycena sp. CBHHK59/15]|nr:hypothetical protein B0H10DRAFT_1962663 [Mycena sp. CBHHK59/15]